MTLLIAEDSLKMRKLLKETVGDYFTEIFECENGIEAFEIYRKNKPDWTLMDIQMPIMDGITATKKITGINPFAKVIIVTNYDSISLRKGAKDAGAIRYIMKENLGEINDIFSGKNNII
jgi:CheY-like chemotaxis protein